MFREFVHFLLTLAHLIFAEEVMAMKGSVLANSLNCLVEGQLLRYACKVKDCKANGLAKFSLHKLKAGLYTYLRSVFKHTNEYIVHSNKPIHNETCTLNFD